MLPTAWRLTRSKDLQKVYRQGKSAAGPFLFVRALPNRHQHARLTVVISKKIAKKAVIRNRLKRVVRQALQELLRDQAFLARLGRQDVIVTVHRDPQLPYSLERLKPEVAQCFERLPSA